MDNPTQDQKCADLARAMGWTQGKASGVWFSPPDSPELCVHDIPPNPYDSTDDSRALVAWLAKQPKSVKSKFGQLLAQFIIFSWEFEGENGTCTLWDHLQDGTLFEDHFVDLLTAPLPVIADAAWRAIAAESSTDS